MAALERLTDVLAVTVQRSASLLGARHPQAKAAREALLEAQKITREARADQEEREQGRRERARREEREGSRARGRSAANGPRTQPHEAMPGGEGHAALAFTSPLVTVVSEDWTPHDPAENLHEVVTRARVVLWDFDGPVCRLFAGRPAERVTGELVMWLDDLGLGGLLTEEERRALDPQVVLKAVDRRHPGSDLVAALEERVTQEELKAVLTAMPTPYADPLIRTWTAVGVRQAVATNTSSQAVGRYVEGRGLLSCLPHIYGRPQDLHMLKPHPYSVHRALRAMGAAPSSALVIGDGPADYEAARAAGVPFLGYARNEREVRLLRNAGADLVVGSLQQVLRILGSSAR
nr:HAD family hydrolase [Streptomyces sp. AC550_RSS872]